MKLATVFSLLLVVTSTAWIWKDKEVFNSKEGEVALSFNLSLGEMSANTQNVYSVLDLNAEAVIFNVDIESFHFNNPLVEQQFKTVYMEVDKFPKTTFVGKLLSKVDLENRETQDIIVNGFLEMHGKNIPRQIHAKVDAGDHDINVHAEFMISASEHGIEIPQALFTDGKDEIKVVLDAAYAR